MKKELKLFLVLSILLFLPGIYYAQHEMLIPAPTDPNVYLDSLITADNPGNVPNDPLRVYVLERGKKYRVHASIVNTGWTLRIKAKDGPGPRPIISITRTVTGTALGQFVNIAGDVWLRSLCVTMRQESDPTTVQLNNGSVLATSAAGKSITVDSCIFSNVSGQIIRTVSAPLKVKVTNSVFANMGNLLVSNFGAGKGIDLRDGSCDTLLFVNNIFVNALDRIVRHRASTLDLKTFIFDRNTVINSCSYHGMFALGWVSSKVQMTNNLFVDAFALGNDSDVSRQAEFDESGELDSWGKPRMTWIVTDEVKHPSTASYVIRNNYYSVSSAGQAWLAKYANSTSATFKFPYTGLDLYASPLTHKISAKLGADSTKAFVYDNITLTKVPALMTALMTNYRDPAGANKKKPTNPPGFDITKMDIDRKTIPFYSDSMDCRYNTSAKAYTGSDGGKPAGALFPWGMAVPTAVERIESLPTYFTLEQNYPNPFNPSTKIVYSLPKNSHVRLEVFDMLGRKVATLVNGQQQVGQYKVDFDGSRLSSGVYVYQLTSSDQIISKKMMLIK